MITKFLFLGELLDCRNGLFFEKRSSIICLIWYVVANAMLLEHPNTICGYCMCAEAGVCSHLVIQSHEAVSVVVGKRGLR